MMHEYLIDSKITYSFMILIMFVLAPEMFISVIEFLSLAARILIWRIYVFILKSGFVYLIRITHIYNLILAKKSLWLELIDDVNEATIVTFYDDLAKCITEIGHNAFNEDDLVTVEKYTDEATARVGHGKWVKIFEQGLPNELKDIINDKIYKRQYFE
ncbi:MAG: hypothetical protein KA807_16755 [Prolixibacteraceae bacterium]|nr:hypothetical protein [Prolixibacteraceae bacterium]